MEARASELLPIAYLHATFTLPNDIGPVALQNKRVVYGALFRAAAATLKEVAANPKHLGAEIGVVAALHTWGEQLPHHPHLHCIVTSGGISPDRSRWVHCKRNARKGTYFFAPGPVLSLVFRGKFIDLLKRAYRRGELEFHGKLASLAQPKEFERFLNRSVKHRWVVDVRPPLDPDAGSSSASPEIVLKYLARYTHRVAISNRRLVAMDNGKVSFRYKDYADGNREKTLELEATKFIRRFLLHILPSGFMKIRHYGFLANRFRREKLALCRQLLGVSSDASVELSECEPDQKALAPYEPDLVTRCPVCGRGKMIFIKRILPEAKWAPRRMPTHSRSPPRKRIA
jgi:hypothetical protein